MKLHNVVLGISLAVTSAAHGQLQMHKFPASRRNLLSYIVK
jgi:hypothetical protein